MAPMRPSKVSDQPGPIYPLLHLSHLVSQWFRVPSKSYRTKIRNLAMTSLEETPIADSTPARVPQAAPRLSAASVVVASRGQEDVVRHSRRRYLQRSCSIDSSVVGLEEWVVVAASVCDPCYTLRRLIPFLGVIPFKDVFFVVASHINDING